MAEHPDAERYRLSDAETSELLAFTIHQMADSLVELRRTAVSAPRPGDEGTLIFRGCVRQVGGGER